MWSDNDLRKKSSVSTVQRFKGMFAASVFSMIYFVAPFYMLTALAALCMHPSTAWPWLYAAPIFLSAILPSVPMPWTYKYLRPMLDYFDYEEGTVLLLHRHNTNLLLVITSHYCNYSFRRLSQYTKRNLST